MNAVEVKNLSKSYGSLKAVDGISFYVEKGTLFAFLGPNGAGKSTTIDILCTFLKADAGDITVNGCKLGKEDGKIRGSIGTVFQEGVLDALLTVEENLNIRGRLYGLKGEKLAENVKHAVNAAGVSEFLKRPYGKLSGGQKRRADIARSLMNTPEILFLDEPTTGLDPQTRKSVWDTVSKLQKETGMTVFLTTHYMEEAARADYVVVMDKGKIAAKGTPSRLKEKYTSDKLVLSCKAENKDEIIGLLNAREAEYAVEGGRITVKIDSTLDSLPIIEKCKDIIDNFEVFNGTMDDAFIAITGKEQRE
jgi:multidrug/hemolysin transport system ATP-binding protein